MRGTNESDEIGRGLVSGATVRAWQEHLRGEELGGAASGWRSGGLAPQLTAKERFARPYQ